LIFRESPTKFEAAQKEKEKTLLVLAHHKKVEERRMPRRKGPPQCSCGREKDEPSRFHIPTVELGPPDNREDACLLGGGGGAQKKAGFLWGERPEAGRIRMKGGQRG